MAKKHYSLYSDKDQTQLLACAEDIDGVLEESKYYSSGCWFEYDESINATGSTIIENEREFGYDDFPSEPLVRGKEFIEADERVDFRNKIGF